MIETPQPPSACDTGLFISLSFFFFFSPIIFCVFKDFYSFLLISRLNNSHPFKLSLTDCSLDLAFSFPGLSVLSISFLAPYSSWGFVDAEYIDVVHFPVYALLATPSTLFDFFFATAWHSWLIISFCSSLYSGDDANWDLEAQWGKNWFSIDSPFDKQLCSLTKFLMYKHQCGKSSCSRIQTQINHQFHRFS